ncbi:multicopper oxidase family protein [Mesorhizobium sp. M1C.F.Ca.ET.212.01.1.1]|uniref:multicopper oxidase family protein n=1 Tax=Mesorhizobium sp. M1C.F.Ca.ET.212.01.1.1 TaxID=2500527 RepID=UPI000FDB9DBD|nr:multicopper oxidase family protein [Mesorhizobium sp. M1C.F.Ca.ET.212.01.1.1]TGQ68136.1 multicopper oxidase family protein [Mesorhizobium sp. M1C.F.Ca.ET.212.01.1.1]
MHRRGFLAAGLATILSGSRALAQMKMDGMSDMDSMPGMGGHAGHDMGPMSNGPAALPEGEALRELPMLANEAGQPGLFKARLTAAPATARFAADQDTPILAYNGMSPGPMIEAHEGDRVEIAFANRIEGEQSTIHWHGMPVPADQDGNPMDPVAAGAERAYAFELPEGSAGSYWYHPHPHGKTAEQVYRGLAGAFVVKAKADPVPAAYGDTVLMFTDLRLAADGSMPDNTMIDQMNGRVGDHVLVNGQKNPRLAVAMGSKRRLRLYNATNARFLRLAFDGVAMTIIGTDGGLLEKPVAAEEIMLSPAERIELVVAFDRPGAAMLTTLDYDRGWMGAGRPADAGLTLLTVDVSQTPGEAMPPLPERLRPIAPLGRPAVSRRLVFTETMAMNATGMEMGFLINGKAFDMGRVDIVARAGETELWEIVNQADMDHPFHVHGTQFQVIEHERDGKVSKPPYLAWKDTVNVARGETVRLLLRQERPGPRMYHCHILEHEQLGMMGIVDVQA